jgi:hypothetical protein
MEIAGNHWKTVQKAFCVHSMVLDIFGGVYDFGKINSLALHKQTPSKTGEPNYETN